MGVNVENEKLIFHDSEWKVCEADAWELMWKMRSLFFTILIERSAKADGWELMWKMRSLFFHDSD